MQRVNFMSLRFDQYDMVDLVSFLMKSNPEEYRTVVTPNVDHVIRANKDPELLELYINSEISVNDSRILKKLAKIIKIDLGNVIPGSDLTKNLLDEISKKNKAITIIGGSEKTVGAVQDKYGIKSLNHYNPPMGFIKEKSEVEKCIKFIVDNKADFIFLAIGSPRQEIIAHKAKERGAKGTALCIGASLLFISGEEKRAPKLYQKFSLEWLYRLFQSPRRLFKRYLIDGLKIFPLLIKEIRIRMVN